MSTEQASDGAASRPLPTSGADDPDVGSKLHLLELILSETIGVRETLDRIAEYSVSSFPDVAGAVATLADRSVRGLFGAPAARLADDLHVTLHEGPAADALATGLPVNCESFAAAPDWPRFAVRAANLGLHSVLAVPLLLPTAPIGVLTVYSARRGAFDAKAVADAQHFALPTAAVVHNACVLEETRLRVAQLTEALEVRPVIDRAVGIMMARTGKTAQQSLATLRELSNGSHVKVSELAAELVDEAARRARRRPGSTVEFRRSRRG